MEVSGNLSIKDVYAESMYPIDSRILLVPLNQDEDIHYWLKFKDLATWQSDVLNLQPENEVFIDVDHKFVQVVTDFAVAAFNELCWMYFKRDVEENIYEAEVIHVNYSRNGYGYLFFITLEAMEEDVSGVYHATVLCNYDDGRRTLIKFIRSSSSPVGKKFKGTSELIGEKLMYQALIELKKDIEDQLLEIRRDAKKGNKISTLSAEFIYLEKNHKAVKGACRAFDKYAHRLKPISWKIKKSNSDNWFVPNKIWGLQPRSSEHCCGGYDYHNPLTVFSSCT